MFDPLPFFTRPVTSVQRGESVRDSGECKSVEGNFCPKQIHITCVRVLIEHAVFGIYVVLLFHIFLSKLTSLDDLVSLCILGFLEGEG